MPEERQLSRLRDVKGAITPVATSRGAAWEDRRHVLLLRLPHSPRAARPARTQGYESAANPDGGIIDSNPYGLLAEPGSRVVADTGATALLRVAANGAISTIATFPARAQGRPTDAVPTAVAGGPDGAYYVSELSGVPFAAGAANIYRVVPGQAPTVAWSGFTTVIDLAFDPDGSLYVLEHSTGPVFFALPGRLLKLAPNGTRTTVIAGLSRPGSVAVGFERRALRLDPEHVDWNRRGTADRALGEASQARGACTAPRA